MTDCLPDDGLRHELIDGAFVMTTAPGVAHQDMSAELFEVLRRALQGTDLKVRYAPVDVVLGANVVQPDLVVAPAVDFTERDLPVAPLLVVEIRSPSTAWLDEGRKRTCPCPRHTFESTSARTAYPDCYASRNRSSRDRGRAAPNSRDDPRRGWIRGR